MACNCNQTPCAPTVQITNCDSCQYTVNSDCVIYKGDRLSYEALTVADGSTRTLTTLLENLEALNCCDRESTIVTGNYTIQSSDVNKIIILKGEMDDVVGGTLTYTLTLPVDIAFANKTLIFKDISGVGSGGRVIVWEFDSAIQYQWSPSTQTSVSYTTLQNASSHKVLRLTFVKTDSVNYSWLVI